VKLNIEGRSTYIVVTNAEVLVFQYKLSTDVTGHSTAGTSHHIAL
jgi:hypothetical protein